MRNRFDRELEQLNVELTEMGAMIESAINSAVEALIQHDRKPAENAADFDIEINNKEHTIESHCLRLLMQQQPVAKDLRIISSALKMITDMERIGDQARDIAEITLRLPSTLDLHRVEHIKSMASFAIEMVHNAIDAFVQRDMDKAIATGESDDVMDRLFDHARDDLIELIRQNDTDAEAAVDLLMIAKYFERIGDHTVNITEWVVFSITGQHEQI